MSRVRIVIARVFIVQQEAAHNVSFYQNEELLELNKDKFVGKPLSNNISTTRNGAGIRDC